MHMLRFIAIMLTIIALLSTASMICRQIPLEYNEQDNEFAHEYAGEMLATMMAITQRGAELEGISAVQACDFYLGGEDEFYRLKYAALHFKGELAEDFVYAFDLAESWCRYAAEAALHPDNERARLLARQKMQAAQAEFMAIANKHYR